MTILFLESITELNKIAATYPAININSPLVQNTIAAKVLTSDDSCTVTASSSLSPEGLLLLGRLIGASETLTHLDMSGNNIGEHAEAFATAIAEAALLNTLDMSSNNIGEHAEAFANAISAAPCLKTLDMSGNNIGKHAEAFANAIATSLSLTSLNISDNNIDNHGEAFTHAIVQSPSLRFLDMEHNNTEEEKIYTIQTIIAASNIKSCDLYGAEEVRAQHDAALVNIHALLSDSLPIGLPSLVGSYFSLPTNTEPLDDAVETQFLLGG